MKFCISVCWLLSTWCSLVYGGDILYISMTPSPSHHIWDKTLALALRERHHRITFLTHSVEKSIENFTVIHFEGIYEKLLSNFDYESFVHVSDLESIKEVYDWFESICEWDFATKGFQELMKLVDSKTHFDVIIFDTTTGHCLYPVIEKLNSPPVVAVSQFGVAPYYMHYFGLDLQTAYVPIYFLPYTNEMTYLQRLNNWFYTTLFMLYNDYIFLPSVSKKAQVQFGNNIIPFQQVQRNMSILLANFDHVLDYPMSLPPAVIPVGGLHTKRVKELPQDIRKILDESKHGIVYFSLGTNWRSADIRLNQRQALIDGLGRLKQTVLWKFEEKIENLPKNIIVRPWMPQNDILAHPNVKVFITHAGGLSTQEAMYHAMPVVCMPFFADQILNSKKMVNRKLGQSIRYGYLTADDVYNTVSEVLNNPIYKQNSLSLSRRYRDQPENALTRAVWWVEYTIRHNGAEQLALPARDIPRYQLALLDIWALILAIIILPVLIILKCCYCNKKCSQSKKKTE